MILVFFLFRIKLWNIDLGKIGYLKAEKAWLRIVCLILHFDIESLRLLSKFFLNAEFFL